MYDPSLLTYHKRLVHQEYNTCGEKHPTLAYYTPDFAAVIYHHSVGNTVILHYKSILPCKLPLNGSKLLQYFNPGKGRIKTASVIYHSIVL